MAMAQIQPCAEQIVGAAVADTIAKLRASLQKEGADIDVEIDDANSTLIVSLVRNRIICEGCIQPEKLVRTMLTNALRADPAANALKYKIEARNWAL